MYVPKGSVPLRGLGIEEVPVARVTGTGEQVPRAQPTEARTLFEARPYRQGLRCASYSVEVPLPSGTWEGKAISKVWRVASQLDNECPQLEPPVSS